MVRQTDTLAAEGPVEEEGLEGSGLQAVSVVWWPQLPTLLGALLEVGIRNEHWLSTSAGRQFDLKPKCMGLGCCHKRDTTCLVPVCMGRIQKPTWLLPSFAQPFVLTLPEILSYQLRKAGILWGRRTFFCSLQSRLFTSGQVNLLENYHHLSPPPPHHCIVQNLIKVASENHIDLMLSSRLCLGSP